MNYIAVKEISNGGQKKKTSMRKIYNKQPNAANLLKQPIWKDSFKDIE